MFNFVFYTWFSAAGAKWTERNRNRVEPEPGELPPKPEPSEPELADPKPNRTEPGFAIPEPGVMSESSLKNKQREHVNK